MPVVKSEHRVLLWLCVLLFGVAASIYLVIDEQYGAQPDGSVAIDYLSPVTIEDIGAVEIAIRGQIFRFQRTENGDWFYHGHAHKTGEEGQEHRANPKTAPRIATALTTFSRTRVERVVAELPLRNDTFGTVFPEVIAAVFAKTGERPVLTLQVGHQTPDGFGRYVEIIERRVVAVIPNFQVEVLLDLVTSLTE